MQMEDETRTLAENARASGLEVTDTIGGIRIYYPNGRRKREVFYSRHDNEAMGGFDVTPYVFIGDYDAVVNRVTGEIEARLTSSGGGMLAPPKMPLRRIPGVEFVGAPADASDEVEEDTDSSHGDDDKRWRLRVERDGISVELSPASDDLGVLLLGSRVGPGRLVSIRLSGITTTTHDEALALLEKVGNSFLFGLELRYSVGVSLARKRAPRAAHRRVTNPAPPTFPANGYDSEPLELYLYGRSAAGLPLLEYLAYYQTLEYYFPIFSREEALRSAKATLTDPGFDPRDDKALGRFLTLTTQSTRNAGNEREQLRATVRACVDALYLKEFVESTEGYIDHFCNKSQAIAGVPRLAMGDGQPDLREQVADRVYAIRCRVVHTKGEGGDAGIDLLLPSSREAQSLQPDVALVRYLAQRALISRAVALRI